MLGSIVVFLHVATMFTVVALHTGPQLLIFAAVRRTDAAAVAAIGDTFARSGRLVPPLGTAGGVLGIVAGLLLGLNLLAPWLLIAYVLFGALVLFGGLVTVPYFARLATAARHGSDDYRALAGGRLTAILLLDGLIYVLIVGDMVVKPFGS